MMNSTSSILKILHLALPSLISIISLKIQTLTISLSLTVSYHSPYTWITFILIILISCAKLKQSRQFLPLTDIGFRQASLVTYFSVELSCTKALDINFKKQHCDLISIFFMESCFHVESPRIPYGSTYSLLVLILDLIRASFWYFELFFLPFVILLWLNKWPSNCLQSQFWLINCRHLFSYTFWTCGILLTDNYM